MTDGKRKTSPMHALSKGLKRFGKGVENALELMRTGRLGAPYQAPHDVVLEDGFLRLRRYHRTVGDHELTGTPLLLVPPLMVTTEIYDISPELSAVSFLCSLGIDVWITDFGKPEHEEGGLDRTLDDHILSISRAIDYINDATGQDLHLGGYSQGGMFAYLTAAYRKNRGLASVITFGSPVDMRKNMPVTTEEDLATRLLNAAGNRLREAASELRGMSGAMSSYGFKLASPRQELKYMVKMIGLLPDRAKLERALPQRRFLGGEGFIAFPGPALRSFLTEFITNNRLMTGGIVVDQEPVGLNDIEIPVLYFVGTKDTFARPASVRAITQVVGSRECYDVTLRAGHFGLVVGSKALRITWPTVAQWIAWRAKQGPIPQHVAPSVATLADTRDSDHDDPDDREDFEAMHWPEPSRRPMGLYDAATHVLDDLWSRLGEMPKRAIDVVDAMRWQLPRLARLASINEHTRVSPARALAEQALAIPDAPFFLWKGRAFSYRDANHRVNQIVAALMEQGVEAGSHVGLLMQNRPEYLTVVCAVNRIGGVAVLIPTGSRGDSLRHALAVGKVTHVVCDGEHVSSLTPCAGVAQVLLLGGTLSVDLPREVVDLGAKLDRSLSDPPENLRADPGRASDLAILMFTSGTTGLPKAARITNRRWAMAALGSAAAAALTPHDTVYCCLPLYHATGLLVAVGGAMLGGSRLVLAQKFSASAFMGDVRRTGATVVFYVGELCRYLVATAAHADDNHHAIRLFAGNGMRPEVWERLVARFGPVRVIEFYGSTEGNALLVNLTGEKVGAVGRPLLSGQGLALVTYDVVTGVFPRNDDGLIERVDDGEPGVLIARLQEDHPLGRFDGYTDDEETHKKVLRDVFKKGDAWFDTGDLMRRDDEGDYWFVDRIGDTFRWKGVNVSTDQVQELVDHSPDVAIAAVYGVNIEGREGRVGVAALQLIPDRVLDRPALFKLVTGNLPAPARPQFLRIVGNLELTETMKPVKFRLQHDGVDPSQISDPLFFYDKEQQTYSPLDSDTLAAVIDLL